MEDKSWEEIRQGYLDNGWREEITETGARIFSVKVSDRILTTKLSKETEDKLNALWAGRDTEYKIKWSVKKWITEIYQRAQFFLNWIRRLIKR